MGSLTAFADSVRHLARSTVTAWWHTLPQVLSVYLLGWFGSELLAQLAGLVSVNAWAALILLAGSFVVKLSAIVICLRILGQDLHIREQLPLGEDDPRDNSVSHLLALTLLPFIGIYATFNKVQEAANRLLVDNYVYYGMVFDNGMLEQLDPRTSSTSAWAIFSIIVSAYLVRRGFDKAFDATGWRPFGLIAAFLEGFFMLMLLMSGGRLFGQVVMWLQERALAQWLDWPIAGAQRLLADAHIDVRALLDWLMSFWNEDFWPALSTAFVQPVLWLAVAALVYGTRALSLAELWRKGEPLSVNLPRRQSSVRVGESRRGVWLEIQEAFFGDIDDKYIPTFQSLRLILGVGLTFLGAFVLLYGAIHLADDWLARGLRAAIGGQKVAFWVAVNPAVDLIHTSITEPLRFALLASAYHLTLTMFHDKAAAREADLAAPAAVQVRVGTPAPDTDATIPRRALPIPEQGERG